MAIQRKVSLHSTRGCILTPVSLCLIFSEQLRTTAPLSDDKALENEEKQTYENDNMHSESYQIIRRSSRIMAREADNSKLTTTRKRIAKRRAQTATLPLTQEPPAKRPRGRPRKHPIKESSESEDKDTSSAEKVLHELEEIGPPELQQEHSTNVSPRTREEDENSGSLEIIEDEGEDLNRTLHTREKRPQEANLSENAEARDFENVRLQPTNPDGSKKKSSVSKAIPKQVSYLILQLVDFG